MAISYSIDLIDSDYKSDSLGSGRSLKRFLGAFSKSVLEKMQKSLRELESCPSRLARKDRILLSVLLCMSLRRMCKAKCL